MTEGTFSALWTKYLPILRIVLKKSIAGEQQVSIGKLELNAIDNRKNANHTFSLEISNGKADKVAGSKVIAKDLLAILNTDPLIRSFMAEKNIYISLGKSSQLTLRSEALTEKAQVSADPINN